MNEEPDIATLLTIGENIVVEFKRAGNGPKSDTFETICAFLNRQGGDILLGVEDDGTVIGLPQKDAPTMVKQIVNVMNDPNLWEPRIAVYPEIAKYKGKTLIRIHVPAGPDVYWFKGKCYDRVNESDVVVHGASPIADMFIRKREIFTENANKAIHPGLITPANLKPYSKNPIIAKFFHEIGRADELGSGVRNLYRYVKLYSGLDPVFDEKDVFRLTVPLNEDFAPEETTLKTTPKTTLKTTLKGSALTIASAVADNPKVTIERLVEISGLKRDGVNYQIRALKKLVGLTRVGGKKGGHWEFSETDS